MNFIVETALRLINFRIVLAQLKISKDKKVWFRKNSIQSFINILNCQKILVSWETDYIIELLKLIWFNKVHFHTPNQGIDTSTRVSIIKWPSKEGG